MRINYRDGVIDAKLSKPETVTVAKALALMTSLSKMQPIRKPLSDAATAATEALAAVLKMAAFDAEEHLPLIDGPAKTAAPPVTSLPAIQPTPAADTTKDNGAKKAIGDKVKAGALLASAMK